MGALSPRRLYCLPPLTMITPVGANTSLTGLRRVFFENQAYHPYHLTALSPWPIMTAISVFGLLASAAMWFNSVSGAGLGVLIGLVAVITVLTNWFGDITGEASLLGLHTKVVQQAHVMGMGLFILTEVMFFFSIFWAFFHSSLSPTIELGAEWPPVGIEAVSPLMIPLLNTALLISSGATVTYAHHSFFTGHRGPALTGMLWTLCLATVFTALQGYEYAVSSFTIADGVFGSCFFFSTGFHGFHVIVGTAMLAVAFARLYVYSVTREHHAGVEAAILYWHFVDVVWLVLYVFVYGWTAA